MTTTASPAIGSARSLFSIPTQLSRAFCSVVPCCCAIRGMGRMVSHSLEVAEVAAVDAVSLLRAGRWISPRTVSGVAAQSRLAASDTLAGGSANGA